MERLQPCDALRAVEVRLLDCLDILHKTRESYFEPDAFRRNLNNLIQAARNVTWILQSNKAKFRNFDSWYGKWQSEMREDEVLRWLNGARVKIVKKGDLETNSVFQITLKESWLSNPKFETTVDPFVSSSKWVDSFVKQMPKDIPFTVGLLRAERRWIDSEFPKEEILKNISHGLRVISHLIGEAHLYVIDSKTKNKCPWTVRENIDKTIDLVLNDWGRVVWYDLSAKRIIDVEAKKTKYESHVCKEEVIAHYPEMANIKPKKSKGFRDWIGTIFEHTKLMLAKDKSLLSIALVQRADNTGLMVPLNFENRAEKHLVFEALANIVKQEGGTSVIMVGEMWFASAEKPFKLTPTGLESKNKRELFKVSGICNTGEAYSLGQLFSRDAKGDIVFEELFEGSDGWSENFFKPIRDVWELP